MERPTERLPDKVLFKRAAVKYVNTRDNRNRRVSFDNFEAAVCYVEPRLSNTHIIRMMLCKARKDTATGAIHIGCDGGSTPFKNAAIGRRSCPICWDKVTDRKTIHIYEHGKLAGTCKNCGKRVDPVLTAVRPYFYYYSTENRLSSPVVVGGSKEVFYANELKEALLFEPDEECLVLPTPVNDHTLLCTAGFSKPIVFSTTLCELQGSDKSNDPAITYDFWNHPSREVSKIKKRRFPISEQKELVKA